MPTVLPPARVLVTGANGYTALWVVRTLLEHGFFVRGTVRAESKAKGLREAFKEDIENGRLEIMIVPDITVPGAYDEAVKGIDAVEHVASPTSLRGDDPDDIIRPAIQGTVGILESALKHSGPRLKRIVVTSSTGAMINFESKGVIDESVWNELSPAEICEKGRAAHPMDKYMASKTLAEREAWDFVTKHESKVAWDLVTICPTWIFGPSLIDVESPQQLGPSLALLYEICIDENKSQDEVFGSYGGWIDVRDLAECHVRSLELPEAGGQRLLLNSGMFNHQYLLDIANTSNIPGIVKRSPGTGKDFRYPFTFDTTKATSVFGPNSYDIYTSIKETVEVFKEKGWLTTAHSAYD